MITHKDILVEGSTYRISLSKLTGKKVEDIHGYLSTEFGEPVFKVSVLVFEDGTQMGCNGEHDMPYIVNQGDVQPNTDSDTLQRLYDEKNAE